MIEKQLDITVQKNRKFSKITYVFLGCILAITFAGALYFYQSTSTQKTNPTNAYTSKNTQISRRVKSPYPSPRVIFRSAESNPNPIIPASCGLDKETNPFISEVYSEGQTIHGEFHGIVENMVLGKDQLPQSVILLSPDRKVTKSFEITQARNEVFDLHVLRDISISKLTFSKEVYIFFDCGPQKNFQLVLTKIGIL